MKAILLATFVLLSGSGPASYIGHPGKVARTITRRIERQDSNPASPWHGAEVQTACEQAGALADNCQVNVYLPGTGDSFYLAGTAYISRSGHKFRVVWS